MDGLTATQQHALSQLQTITNGESDVAKSVLESVDWDVQKAAEMIFDTAPVAGPSIVPRSPSPPRRMEPLDLDDSRQGDFQVHRRRRAYSFMRLFPSYPTSFMSLLAFPLHLISSVFRFIFGVLRIPIPQLPFTSLNFYRPLPSGPSDPRSVADRWVRALEDETGAVCISRANVIAAAASSGMDAGPSTLTSRTGCASADHGKAFEEGRKLLPDFTLGSYEDILKMCQREAKIACIILVSEEHDDVSEFKRSTLTDPAFVKLLYDNEIIVWGGDVRDQEAWSAAQKLQVTTYPFVAFLALQPRRGTRSAASNTNGTTTNPPTLTILSRHQGRCAPTSTSPTSPTSLTTHLNSQLLPRILPFLERIRNTARERDRDRLLREEQDRAFRDAARRDRERIQGRMEEERRKVEEQSRRKEEAMREVERREVERVEEENKEAARMEWRRWARRIAVEPQANATTSDAKGSGVIRLAIRLPGGDRRSIREFSPSDTLTNLYAYVDSQFIPPSLPTSSDPLLPPENDLTSPEQTPDERIEAQIRAQSSAPSSGAVGEGKADIWWGFKLVLAYPRRELAWAPHTALRDIEGLKGGAQIVVEKVGVSPKARGSSTSPRSAAASPTPPAKEDEAEDGYDTESD